MSPSRPDDDGLELLGGQGAAQVLAAAARHHGGRLLSWRLDHVDSTPGVVTTATFDAWVDWPEGGRRELIGCTVRAGGLLAAERAGTVLEDGRRELAAWFYPHDPALPGLARAASVEAMVRLVNRARLTEGRIRSGQLQLQMVSYRPGRRAVLRLSAAGRTFYVKVLRVEQLDAVLHRHEVLARCGVPAARVVAVDPQGLLVLAALPGDPLSRAVFADQQPCAAEALVELLDGLPVELAGLPRRTPWSDAVDHFATLVARSLPVEQERLEWLAEEVATGLSGIPAGVEPTHGDFHESQLHVRRGRVQGLLDVDTLGPGRRADDLACLVAHLATVQRMDLRQAGQVQALLHRWVPVFDERVDAAELRLRAAGVAISLATGPFRGQEDDWRRETRTILDVAEGLVRQVR